MALKNPSPLPGFKPATFGSSGQHTNHYTTEATTECSLTKTYLAGCIASRNDESKLAFETVYAFNV
jgi:hypothetical protein